MRTWMAVVLVGAASYGLRVVPLCVRSVASPTPTMARILRHAGIAAMAALVMQSLRDQAAGDPGRAVSALAAMVVGVLAARRGRSLVVVVLAGWAVAAVVSAVVATV